MNHAQKTWLITGCSSGLGFALAEAVLNCGDRVMLTARRPETLTGLVDRFPEAAHAVMLDVTDPSSVKRAIGATEEAFGSLDVFVNNAGFGIIGAVEEVSPQEYRRMFETNVFGLIEATRAALPALAAAAERSSICLRVRASPLAPASASTARRSLPSRRFPRRWRRKQSPSACGC